MELSIDTSTRYAGVGLSEEGRLLAEYSWVSRQNHSVELLPAIDHLLKTNGATPKDLTCVFVAIGPGGFSALRVGLSTAKGLVVSLGIPLVALNTLEIEADPFRSLGLPVCAVLDAGRNEVAAAVYAEEDGVWKTVRDAWIAAPEELCSSIEGAVLFCGEGSSLLEPALKECSGDGAVLAEHTPPTRRPGTLARMGYERLLKGEQANVSTLEPFYLRKPSITAPRRPS